MPEAKTFPPRKLLNLSALVFCLLTLCGCATPRDISQNVRPFSFDRDTTAYANELKSEYYFDPDGKWRGHKRKPTPDYTLHCFVVARTVRQFFLHAEFNASQPKVSDEEYRKRVHDVLHRSSIGASPLAERVSIPGFADLREFSKDYEKLLKKESGGAWHSYFQRGHWRMLLPFSAKGQEKMAMTLAEKIKNNGAPIVHLVRFPQLTINHATILYAVTETPEAIRFSMYDPNVATRPTTLTFDRKTKHFTMPSNAYFPGGKVNVYQVYKSFWY